MAITITEKAAQEAQRIISTQQQADKLYLRLGVSGGGCSGLQHKLDLDANVNPEEDILFEQHGVPVVVDKQSFQYLSDVTLDFYDELNRRGFSFQNPRAKSTCGCGSSFSV